MRVRAKARAEELVLSAGDVVCLSRRRRETFGIVDVGAGSDEKCDNVEDERSDCVRLSRAVRVNLRAKFGDVIRSVAFHVMLLPTNNGKQERLKCLK